MEIIGHRGAKGLAPENTIRSITFALKQKVDWVEFDVRLTKDRILVVIHDHTLNRITKERGQVRHYTYAEIQAMATRSGEPVPTFLEVCKTIGRKAKLDIELKEKGCANMVLAEIQHQVAAGRPYTDFMVSSFKPWLLQEIQHRDKKVPLLLLQLGWPFLFLFLPFLKLYAVGFSRYTAPRVAIRLAQKRGLWTVVYTVNDRSTAHHFELLGVDALVTDFPHALRKNSSTLVLSIALGLLIIVLAILFFIVLKR